MSNRSIFGIVAGAALLFAAGCAHPSPTTANYPARASELDLLDAWVGEWDSTSEIKIPGEDKPVHSRGHESIAWKCNKQFLLEEMSWTEDGAEQSAMAVRTWDPHARLFRSWYYDNHGMVGQSTMTWSPASHTWTVHTENADPQTCLPTVGEMTIRQVDPGRQDWHFIEYDKATHKKRLEMTGVSPRK